MTAVASGAAGGLLLTALGLAGLQVGSRTRILLDEAHHNLYAAASGGYRSFVQLVTNADFSVARNSGPFSLARLYSVREADNRRFALNIVRWLAREL